MTRREAGKRARALAAPVALALLSLAACGAAGDLRVDGRRAHARVVFQVDAGPRVAGSAGHARVRQWLEHELTRLGARVEVQHFTDTTLGQSHEVFNLIAHYSPHGAGRGPLVLCAHYDSRPWSDQDPEPAHRGDPMPGANDAGSGVAVLLEVAELMSRRTPPCPVDLVFFDAEDLGRNDQLESFSIGARGYAARLQPPLPRAAILFDMVGDRELDIYPERNSVARASNLVDQVLEGARATGARHFHPEPRYTMTDDHIPLLDRGVPAVDIIDFDYPAWHTHLDLPDRVAPESLAEVSRVAAWLVYSSALGHGR